MQQVQAEQRTVQAGRKQPGKAGDAVFAALALAAGVPAPLPLHCLSPRTKGHMLA
jgi:hypothetical protein